LIVAISFSLPCSGENESITGIVPIAFARDAPKTKQMEQKIIPIIARVFRFRFG